MSSDSADFRKDPAIAVVCSFLVCGLGHVYVGDYAKGFALMIAYGIAWALTGILIGFLIVPVLWVYGLWSAHHDAVGHNERLARGGEARAA
jgi:TM2 domain-containing membrane protein YozV